MSRLHTLVFFILIAVFVKSQPATKDYLITIENVKIPVTVNFIRNNAKVFCDVNGKQVKYKAKQIKEIYFNDTLFAQSIRVGNLFKRWLFAEIKIDGELKFGSFCFTKGGLHSSTGERTSSEACSAFLILSTDPHGVCYKIGMFWKKNVKKAIRNCPAAIAKTKELKGYYAQDIALFYNKNCKK